MRRIYLLLVCLCLSVTITPTLQAQTTPQYRLRVPTVEEYLAAIPAIVEQLGAQLGADIIPITEYLRLSRTIQAEIEQRYVETLADGDYATLRQIYDVFDNAGFFENQNLPLNDWNRLLIQAWLAENPVDFSQIKEIAFDDYRLTVLPYDFDVNSENEYLLEVIKNCRNSDHSCHLGGGERNYIDYAEYVIARSNSNGSYTLSSSPLPWLTSRLHYSNPASGHLTVRKFEDLTGDGISEWVVELGGISGGQHNSRGRLYVMTWREHQVQVIAPLDNEFWFEGRSEPPYTLNYDYMSGGRAEWVFENIDADPAIEIMQVDPIEDNRNCHWQRLTTFDYDNSDMGQYVFLKRENQFEDTPFCQLRYAEAAMTEQDFATAAHWYEQAIPGLKAKFLNIPFPQSETTDQSFSYILPYAQGRWIIALALSGQISRIEALIDLLEPADAFILALQTAYRQSATAESLCKGAYDFFASQPDYHGEYDLGGVYDSDQTFLHNFVTVVFNPFRDGCDMHLFGFEPTPHPTQYYPTPTPDPAYAEYLAYEELISTLNSGVRHFHAGEYQEALQVWDDLASPIESYPFLHHETIYYRALTLEGMNRPDEALAEYIVIYEAAPDSAWGMLAALHVEPTEE